MTLSFLQAYRAKQRGAISWEEYIHSLVARCAGIKHEKDNVKGGYWELRNTDPFGYSIWCLSEHHETIKDPGPLEAVFKAYRRGTIDDVKQKLALLDGEHAEGVRKSLAFLALLERQPDVLKFCLDEGGFAFEAYFIVEADNVDEKKDSKTFDVLKQSKFGQLYPKKDNSNSSDPAAIFDRGGKLPVEW